MQATRGQDSPAALPPAVQAFVLGGFKVVVRGQDLPEHAWRRKSARQLFKILLSRPNRRMTRDEVIELLWPESDSDAASSNLRSTVHAMRRAFENAETEGGLGIIFGDRDSVWLRPDVELWVDADAFDECVKRARHLADPQQLLEQASSLYSGHYLPDDLYEDWATERRDALRRTWTDIQFELAQAHLERGEPEAAVRELQRVLRADPCDERAAQQLMQVLIQHRRRSEALRVFQNLEQALREELDVEPSEHTRELQRQAAMPEASASAPRRSVFQCSYTFPEPSQLIGREAELARLHGILDRGRTAGQAVLISAPAGTGKSTLVGALVKSARRSGVLCLAGAAYDQRSAVPLAAFQEAFTDYVLAASSNPLDAPVAAAAAELIEAVRDVRQHPSVLGTARSDASAERSRLFTALLSLVRRLAERTPVLVCLEDLHVADEASIQLLHYLVRQTRHSPVVFAGTLRAESLQPGEPLSQLAAALAREHLAEQMDLPPLDRSATDRLLGVLIGEPLSRNVSSSIYAATDGNPLFVEQLVLSLRDDGRLDRAGAIGLQVVEGVSGVPIVVRELIEERLAKLSPRGREALEFAAVLGHTFDYADLLAVVEPADEASLLTDLDEAIRAQLLRERPLGYAFGHSLLRDGVYWGLSRPRRMLLHGRAGEMLERRAGGDAPDFAAELAHHFANAGFAAPIQTKAIQYSLRAGRQATVLASHRDALHHFEMACEVIDRGVIDVDVATRVAALEGRGLAQDGIGLWPDGIASHRRALGLAVAAIDRARARREISFALNHLGRTAEAQAEAEAGLADLGGAADTEAAIERLILQHQLAWLWFLQGRFEDVLRLGLAMVQLAKQLEEPRWLAWAHTIVGSAHTGSGRTALALEQYGLTLSTAEQGASIFDMARNRSNLGLEYYRAGQFGAAQGHLEQAVTLYREASSEPRAVLALQGLGWVHLAQGNLSRAQEYADLAAALATDAQDRWLAECLQLSGALHMLRAEWAAANDAVERALEIHRQVGHVVAIVESLVQLGRIAEGRGAFDAAFSAYSRAVSTADEMDAAPCAAAAHRCLGLLLLRTESVLDGRDHIEHAIALADGMAGCLEYAPALLARAELERHAGQPDEALATATQALAGPHTAEFAVEAHLSCAQLLLDVGRHAEASTHVAEALRSAEALGAPLLLGAAHRVAGSIAAALSETAAHPGAPIRRRRRQSPYSR